MHKTFADARTMINVLAFPFLMNISFGFYKAGTGCRSSKALWFMVIVTLFIGFLSVFEFFYIDYFGFGSE